MAELMSCDTSVPRPGNSGMSTNWMPGAGRGCTPGFNGSADSIAARVGPPKAAASFWYCGISYVDARLPAGTRDQPSCSPTSFSYSLPDAQEMNFQALSFLVLACWMPHDHAYSHPELFVLTTGAATYPILPLTGESAASSEPAAEVASYHMAALPWIRLFRHSVNPACGAPFSPCARTRST